MLNYKRLIKIFSHVMRIINRDDWNCSIYSSLLFWIPRKTRTLNVYIMYQQHLALLLYYYYILKIVWYG